MVDVDLKEDVDSEGALFEKDVMIELGKWSVGSLVGRCNQSSTEKRSTE